MALWLVYTNKKQVAVTQVTYLIVSTGNNLIVSTGKQKKHKLRVDNSVLFGKLSEDFKPGAAFQIALRDLSEEVKEEAGYIGVFATKTDIRTSTGYHSLKEVRFAS